MFPAEHENVKYRDVMQVNNYVRKAIVQYTVLNISHISIMLVNMKQCASCRHDLCG